jgi:regulator of RNase E activity RraA
MQFMPIQDFFSEAFDSHYVKGFTYTVRVGNDKLRRAVLQWAKEGKVAIVDATTGTSPANLGGTGKVGT